MMIWRWVLVILIGLIIGLFLLAYFGDRVVPTIDEHENVGDSNG